MAATGALPVAAVTLNPGGGAATLSPWLIQTAKPPSALRAKPDNSREGPCTRTSAGPNSRFAEGTTAPPK